MDDDIRQVLLDHGQLHQDVASLADDTDLYRAGLTSHATVNVMFGLENAFDVEFPDAMLRRSTFESIGAIRVALVELGVRGQVGSYAPR